MLDSLITLIDGNELDDMRGRKHTIRYDDINDGTLTKPIKFGRRSCWVKEEIAVIVAAEIRGATKDELRAIVARLEATREERLAPAFEILGDDFIRQSLPRFRVSLEGDRDARRVPA